MQALLATESITTNYIRDPSGEVLGYSRGNLNRFFVRDLTGTVIDITNNGGNRMDWFNYSPYGELIGSGGADEFVPFRFAQGYLDEETGLQKHGVRYYGMGIARWTQLDPVFGQITDPVTLNRYQYANCDPANNVDPTGRSVSGCVSDLASVVAGYVDFAAGLTVALVGPVTGPATPVTVGAGLAVMSFGLASMYYSMRAAEQSCPG